MLGRDSHSHTDRGRDPSAGVRSGGGAALLIAMVFVLVPAVALIATVVLAMVQGSILRSVFQTFSGLQTMLIILAVVLLLVIFIALGMGLARWLSARTARAIAYGKLLAAYETSRAVREAGDGTSAERVTIVDAAPYSPGQLQQALLELDHILEQHPENVDAWVNKGAVLFELQHDESALGALDSALALDRDHAKAWAVRGKILLYMGRHREATKNLARALKLDPLNEGARQDLEDARHRRTPQRA